MMLVSTEVFLEELLAEDLVSDSSWEQETDENTLETEDDCRNEGVSKLRGNVYDHANYNLMSHLITPGFIVRTDCSRTNGNGWTQSK